ncbi:MAG: peptide chain release factor N(5)-glutamine methyltransferase [Clostridia bacterium]|nr:peptide chain release factor N(5)-glutamine methyltransferase [Clostridia bacterium]
MKLKDLRRFAKRSLADAGISDADSSKLELLFEYAFNFTRNFILSEPDHEIPEGPGLTAFRDALSSVCGGVPVQYVIGYTYFSGLKFEVSKDVLIPRLETELLVDMGADIVSGLTKKLGRPVRVLDLCSGSGAIGISVKHRCPSCDMTLSDISRAAITVSQRNAESILGSVNAVKYAVGSFLEPFKGPGSSERFDVILSNPPYIPTEVIKTLPRDVRDHEPRLALDGGAEGTVPYDIITRDARSVLSPSGALVFEIGEEQGKTVRSMMASRGFADATVIKDLEGKDRFVKGFLGGATFDTPVSEIKGVGPKTEAALKKLGITDLCGLIRFYPAGYEDRKNITDTGAVSAMLAPGESTFATLVLRVNGLAERGNPAAPVLVYSCSDKKGVIDVVFFNNRYVKNIIRVGKVYYFYGRIKRSPDFFGSVSMQQPKFADASNEKQASDFLTLSPVYRTGGKLGNKEVSNAVRGALSMLDGIGDGLPGIPDMPSAVLSKYGLPAAGGLIRAIHFPKNSEEAAAAKRRVDFEELLEIALNIQALKKARESGLRGNSFKPCDLSEFKRRLPFELTKGQLSVIDKIFGDMASPAPMNRLINGDVGSGKTVVALAAIYNAVMSGFQAALMVPSTVLAAQHMAKISEILGVLGIGSEMLYSGTGARERKRIIARIESGEPVCVIGTHSLISETVSFKKLGLVVIDEQHRFGVLQRAALIAKSGDTVPDVLSLTATPIPRSLALVLYGDMDISVLTEKPAGRMPVETYIYPKKDRLLIYRRSLNLIKKGGRVYIVHSKIDNNEGDDVIDPSSDDLLGCVENFKQMSGTVFSGVGTALIHGKMSDREKQKAMEKFASGEAKVLFSTTVIEVGVDVPAATLMIIEDAERFGLSTLHQLRGRVGRGSERSFCILISDKSTDRLEIMTETNDGFKIAEKDLELRGPGDFFGTSQTGTEGDRALISAADPRLLSAVKESADYIVKTATDGSDHESVKYYDAVTEKARHITL